MTIGGSRPLPSACAFGKRGRFAEVRYGLFKAPAIVINTGTFQVEIGQVGGTVGRHVFIGEFQRLLRFLDSAQLARHPGSFDVARERGKHRVPHFVECLSRLRKIGFRGFPLTKIHLEDPMVVKSGGI